MKRKDKRLMILDYLKKTGRASTSKIAFTIRADLNIANRYLAQLESKGRIKKEKESLGTFWVLI